MKIKLNKVGKKFNRTWIFKDLDYEFQAGNKYAITGGNGSGKSTLLQLLSGFYSPNQGKAIYEIQNQNIAIEDLFKKMVLVAPYLELIEEMSLDEVLKFHFRFKKIKAGFTFAEIMEIVDLKAARYKMLQHFSSGMKQRVQLALAFFSDVPLILLDEPTTNLDQKGIDLYSKLIDKFTQNQLLIISSNQKHEYDFCDFELNIEDYK